MRARARRQGADDVPARERADQAPVLGDHVADPELLVLVGGLEAVRLVREAVLGVQQPGGFEA